METCCDQSTENNQMTDATTTIKHDDTSNGKKIILSTVECLRGRLLAERHASRVAKEDAESMENKFVELERKLKEEIKLRDKAERKLRFLKKKLESFNSSSSSGQSYSSQKCENSCGSSSSSSASKLSEGYETKKAHTINPSLLENAVQYHNVAEACVLIQTKYCGSQFNDTSSFKNPNQSSENLKNDENRLSSSSSKSLAKSYNSQGTVDYISNPSSIYASTENIFYNPNPSYVDLKNDESRLSSLSSKSSVMGNEGDHGEFVDNSLALFPVTLLATSQATSNHKPVNESVVEALDASRRAKESILCSMGTRPMIKVGPT